MPDAPLPDSSLPDSPLHSTGALGAIQLLLGLRRRFRVAGPSMEPVLHDGETVLIDERAYRHTPPREGDLVLARHPQRNELLVIKRVRSICDDGRLDLRGDNPAASTDSRMLGPFPASAVVGRVAARFP